MPSEIWYCIWRWTYLIGYYYYRNRDFSEPVLPTLLQPKFLFVKVFKSVIHLHKLQIAIFSKYQKIASKCIVGNTGHVANLCNYPSKHALSVLICISTRDDQEFQINSIHISLASASKWRILFDSRWIPGMLQKIKTLFSFFVNWLSFFLQNSSFNCQ